jgi:hypothetical protein
MSLVGQLHALPRRSIAVCFTSHSGYKHQPNGLLVSAKSGREQMQQYEAKITR